MTRWSFGTDGDIEARLTRAFACFLEQVVGLGLVWATVAGDGAAVWVPPNRFADLAEHPWSHPQITALTEDDGRRYGAFWTGSTAIIRPTRCGSLTRSPSSRPCKGAASARH
jgi:hypothetical protein